jgi:hypothetical protein
MTFKALPVEEANLSDVTGVLAVEHGGTNQSTALNNNRFVVSSADKFVEHGAITASRVLLSDADGLPVAASAITPSRVLLSDASGFPTASAALTASRVLLTNASGFPVAASAITASRALVSDVSGFPVASSITTSQLSSTLYWTKYSVIHTALQAAALTNDIELFSLPASTLIHKVIIKQTTAFAGTTTYTLSVGIVGTLVKYIAAYDVMAAVSDTTFGVAAVTVNATLENFGAATSIRLAAVSTVENLDQSSAGAADIYVLTSLLP